MSANVVWRGEAIRDVQEAYDWYEAGTNGVGEELLAEIDEFVAFIAQRPEGPAKWRSRYRKLTLKRFPYQVVYRFERGTVIIYSVFHSSRNPSRWGRLH
jgi:plasmid stabilization system protein ParE